MRWAAKLLAYAAILLGYLLAFESVTPAVTLKLDKKVYAFSKKCTDGWRNNNNVTEPECVSQMNFTVHANERLINCAEIKVCCSPWKDYVLYTINTCENKQYRSPTDNASVIVPILASKVFQICALKLGRILYLIAALFYQKKIGNSTSEKLEYSNLFQVKFQYDTEPTVRFEVLKVTSYQEGSYHKVDDTSGYRDVWSRTVTLGSESFDSKVVVNIIVEGADVFKDNADSFEYCAVSVPNVRLSAFMSTSDLSFSLNTEKYIGQTFTWWQSSTVMQNGTLVQVQYTFYVSAMSTAINAWLNNAKRLRHMSDTSSFDVNFRLDVSATSCRTLFTKQPERLDLRFTMKHELLKATSNCTDVLCSNVNADATTNGSCSSSSSSSCLVSLQLDKRVYAFKPECVSDWLNNLTSPNCNYSLGFKVIRERNRNPLGWTADELIESLSVEYSGRNYSLALDRNRKRELFEQSYNESANADYVDFKLGVGEIFKTVKQDMVGKVSFWLRAKFRESRFTTYEQVDQYSEARVQFEIDKAPTVRFQVLNDASSQSQVGSTMMHTMSGVNGAWSSTVNLGLKSLGSKVVLNVTVNDADVFEENADRFECSAIGEVSVTLSAVVRLSRSTLRKGEATTPDGLPSELVLALNTGEDTQALTWWQNATLEKNEALLKVQYSFDVSALSLAVNARLKQANKNIASNWDTQVTLTLSATATSGRTHSQKGAGSINLVLSLGAVC